MDGGNGGQPACPGKWKRYRKKNMNSNINVMYIHVSLYIVTLL
jgi:hypothetical protein